MTERLDGRPVASAILDAVKRRVEEGRGRGARAPMLASVHLAATSPFSFYLKNQAKVAASAGVDFRALALPEDADAPGVATLCSGLDRDPSVDAVLVEHPLPAALDFLRAVSALRPEKDVDGVSPVNLGRLVARRPIQVPAVALAAMAILRHYQIPVAGRRVTVVGRSETVGVPIALLLLARGEGGDATVTVAHSATRELKQALSGSEVVISCAGHPGLLTRDVVPEGAAVIDVGLSTVPDPNAPSGSRSAGDADGRSLDGWAASLTPVPGGVGPVTVAQLMSNVVHGWSLLLGGPPP